jgi:uncharacterized DUF497 family protein
MNIEFNQAKNKTNFREHKINFTDVEGVFYDQNAITIEDRDHSEQRFITLGMDEQGRVLVVCYTYRSESTIRLISARKAEPHERKTYEG